MAALTSPPSDKVSVFSDIQPVASVMVTVYIPAHNPVAAAVS